MCGVVISKEGDDTWPGKEAGTTGREARSGPSSDQTRFVRVVAEAGVSQKNVGDYSKKKRSQCAVMRSVNIKRSSPDNKKE